MPYKDPKQRSKKRKEYSKRWYEKNKKLQIERVNAYKKKKREEWQAYKAEQSCAHCGLQHPAVIDFHHVVRDKTKQSVNKLAQWGKWKKARKEAEEKCIPLCANCHRILHWNEHDRE